MAKKSGNAMLPSTHWEKKPGQIECCNLKYSNSEMGAPEELKRAADGLASYVKKNKEKH